MTQEYKRDSHGFGIIYKTRDQDPPTVKSGVGRFTVAEYNRSATYKSNRILPTPFTYVLDKRSPLHASFSGTAEGTWHTDTTTGNGFCNEPSLPGSFPDTYTTRVRATWSLQNSTANTQIGLGVMAAESKETFQFLLSLVKTVTRMIKAIKSGNITELASVFKLTRRDLRREPPSKQASERWLQYFFAVVPLVNDIYDILKDWDTDQDYYMTTKGSATAYSTEQSTSWPRLVLSDYGYPTSTFLYGTLSASNSTRYKVQTNFKVYWRLGDPAVRLSAQLGLINPALIAWNIIPFSFVIDWFLPVSNFLEGFTYSAGLEFENGYRTDFRRADVTTRVDGFRPFSTNPDAFGSGHGAGTASREFVTRAVLQSEPGPAILINFESFDVWKTVTSLALIRQLIN